MRQGNTYKQLAALFLIAAFFTQSFCKSFIVVDYYTNTKAYAKNCENKTKPKMRCNGKCQMMKKLQQEEKKDQENPGRKAENKNDLVLFSKSFFASENAALISAPSLVKIPIVPNGKPIEKSFDIFHPPKV